MDAATDYVTSMPRAEQERKGCIRTFTGRYVNPLQLQPADICIEDIAHHLANICRYTGACPSFYSVAQHSLYVSRQCAITVEGALAGLLHDAAEAYFNDIASPVKHDPRMKWYRDLEHAATRMIFEVFDLDPELLPLTKPADDAIFRREVASWWAPTTLAPQNIIRPWLPYVAEQSFLYKFNKLRSLR
jgi:hypothetical protein